MIFFIMGVCGVSLGNIKISVLKHDFYLQATGEDIFSRDRITCVRWLGPRAVERLSWLEINVSSQV